MKPQQKLIPLVLASWKQQQHSEGLEKISGPILEIKKKNSKKNFDPKKLEFFFKLKFCHFLFCKS